MRSVFLALLLVTSVFALPAASAKSFAEDPSGDTQTRALGGLAPPAGVAMPGADAADLQALDLTETAEEMVFVLKVANLAQQVNFADYAISFSWAKDEYEVRVQRQVVPGLIDDDSNAYLRTSSDGERFSGFAQLEHRIDIEKGTITVHLPKVYILNENGRFPLLGDELEDLFVEASSYSTLFQFSAESYDRMPDGDAMLKYAFLFGDLATGHLRLDADERVRVSNGGATTFVYQVVVNNKADIDDVIDITIADLPEGWNGTVQSPLKVPGGSERRVAVLMSVPFGHEHGGFSSFNLTALSQRDPASSASVRMGVLHTPIPQPAGHHSELYLHAKAFNNGILGQAFPFTGAGMNTEAAHDGDAAEATPNGGDGRSWWIPLDPGLRMGLDFDLEKVGDVSGAIIGHGPATGALSAELVLVTESADGSIDEGITLAESDSQDMTLDLSTPQPFKLTLTPTEESDFIPYVRGQNMVLILRFEDGDGTPNICCFTGTTAGLTTADFKLVLPLNEYHDKLNGLTEAAESLELKAQGAVEKAGLPGTTMTYVFMLTNRGTEKQVIDLDLAGTDAAFGTLVPGYSIELGAQETKKLTLAVNIPVGKNEGEELEVLIFAHAKEDPSKSAIARTKTIIAKMGSGNAADDESGVLLAAQQAETNKTPGLGSIGALAAIGVGVVALRQRRR